MKFIWLGINLDRFMQSFFDDLGHDDFGFWFNFINSLDIAFERIWTSVGLSVGGVARYRFVFVKLLSALVEISGVVEVKGRFFHILIVIMISIIDKFVKLKLVNLN